MKQKKSQGFTLVEMLIVMGILSVLMTIGVAVGRFAIQRANRIAHQGAVDQIFDGLQAYYTDNRKYPSKDSCTSFETLMTDDTDCLGNYLEGSFDGGAPATYYYNTNDNQQEALVCVTLGGVDDESGLGMYCEGNGFGTVDNNVNENTLDPDEDAQAISSVKQWEVSYSWDGEDWNNSP
jgi:prepilin-type N-terminal cleavage/methylation domain-containing protein